jgi:hypothetical protein
MGGDEQTRGSASGFAVEEDPQGGFRWSAYGPLGSRVGREPTREEAESSARAAERELSESLRSPDEL